jgi:DNA topoisomerase-3
VVDRDRSIADFVPVPFWAIEVQLESAGQVFNAQWRAPQDACDDQGRCLQQPLAQQAAAAMRPPARRGAQGCHRARARSGAAALRPGHAAGAVLENGLGAQETLDIAQALYETHKLITYPRSDCGYLPLSQHGEAPAILAALQRADASLAPLQRLEPQRRSRAWNDAKVSAHHGIIPTAAASDPAPAGQAQGGLHADPRRYLAQFLPNHEYDRTQAEFDCAGQRCARWASRSSSRAGAAPCPRRSPRPKAAKHRPGAARPARRAGLRAAWPALKDLWTQPPKPFTEGDLIKAMKNVAKLVDDPLLKQKLKETTGIGTEATRASIIQGLLDRGYLVKNGKALSATPAAFSLIDAVPRAIADPGTTAIWEQALDMVQSGEMSLEEFVARQSAWMGKLVQRCAGMRLNISGPPRAGGKGAPWKKKRGGGKRKAEPGVAKATTPRRRKTAGKS